jgi:hypothetical protein
MAQGSQTPKKITEDRKTPPPNTNPPKPPTNQRVEKAD